jgi:hypothetical protein
MNKITIDLVKLLEQAVPQVFGSIEPLLLQQWLSHNAGTTLPVTVDLVTLSIENEVETPLPVPGYLQPRINDVTTFDDDSELRIQVLAPSRNRADLATDAYYGLLAAISNI